MNAKISEETAPSIFMAPCSSKELISTNKSIWHRNPKNNNMKTHCTKNTIKSYVVIMFPTNMNTIYCEDRVTSGMIL
jgi:hypothetical protein